MAPAPFRTLGGLSWVRTEAATRTLAEIELGAGQTSRLRAEEAGEGRCVGAAGAVDAGGVGTHPLTQLRADAVSTGWTVGQGRARVLRSDGERGEAQGRQQRRQRRHTHTQQRQVRQQSAVAAAAMPLTHVCSGHGPAEEGRGG